MSFEDLAPPAPRNARTITMSAREMKKGAVKVTLCVPFEFLEYFGRPMPDRYAIGIGRGSHRGELRLAPAPDGLGHKPATFVPRGRSELAIARFNLGEPEFAPGGGAEADPARLAHRRRGAADPSAEMGLPAR